MSDDPSLPDGEERKDDVRERVRRTGGYAAGVYAADKVAKVRELRTLLARGVPREEARFKFRRYVRSLEMLEGEIPGSRLVELLRFEIESLARLPPDEGAVSAVTRR